MIVTTQWIFGLVRPRKLWIAAAPTLPAMIDNTSVCRAFIITPLPVVARTPRVLARTFEIMLRPRETRNQKRLSWRKYSLWLWRFCRRALVAIGTFGSRPRDGMGHCEAAPPSSVTNSRRFHRRKCVRSLTGRERIEDIELQRISQRGTRARGEPQGSLGRAQGLSAIPEVIAAPEGRPTRDFQRPVLA